MAGAHSQLGGPLIAAQGKACTLALLALALMATACGGALKPEDSGGASTTRPSVTGSPIPGSALAALILLPVKGRAPKTGYARAEFGLAWFDLDQNGCDTRNDVLRRDLAAIVIKVGSKCVVLSGILHDPYSGHPIPFRRGKSTSASVQIDHVVALSDAWQTGAQQLNAAQRRSLANDPVNLLAVDGRLNQQKSDSDAASWLPPRKSYQCAYLARQVAVKRKYHLWVTPAENTAVRNILTSCPGEPLPHAG
jgi:hypothetical protein